MFEHATTSTHRIAPPRNNISLDDAYNVLLQGGQTRKNNYQRSLHIVPRRNRRLNDRRRAKNELARHLKSKLLIERNGGGRTSQLDASSWRRVGQAPFHQLCSNALRPARPALTHHFLPVSVTHCGPMPHCLKRVPATASEPADYAGIGITKIIQNVAFEVSLYHLICHTTTTAGQQ